MACASVTSAAEMMAGMLRYDSGEGAGPIQTASSASLTYLASLSASEYTTTVLMPSSRQARWMRRAISPRFAIRIFSNIVTLCEEKGGPTAADRGVPGEGSRSAGGGAGTGTRNARWPSPPWLAGELRRRLRAARHAGQFQPMMNSGWPYSTAWPFSTRISLITPALSDSISLSSFIASMMQTVWPSLTVSPTLTNDAAPGDGAR